MLPCHIRAYHRTNRQGTYLEIRLCPEILDQVGRDPPLMPVCLVVKVEHMTLRV
jgi:hypothetical protein